MRRTDRALGPKSPRSTVFAELHAAFQRNGYWRGRPDPKKSPKSHRGYECRFSAASIEERNAIVKLLRAAGLRPGRPFAKGPSWRVPVYGKAQVEVLLAAFRQFRQPVKKPSPRATRSRR